MTENNQNKEAILLKNPLISELEPEKQRQAIDAVLSQDIDITDSESFRDAAVERRRAVMVPYLDLALCEGGHHERAFGAEDVEKGEDNRLRAAFDPAECREARMDVDAVAAAQAEPAQADCDVASRYGRFSGSHVAPSSDVQRKHVFYG